MCSKNQENQIFGRGVLRDEFLPKVSADWELAERRRGGAERRRSGLISKFEFTPPKFLKSQIV